MISTDRSADANTFLNDIKGGSTAAVTAVPVELVYGLFAVVPLGAQFAEHGIRAALWGCVLGGILGYVFRGTGALLTGSGAAAALILGALCAELINHPEIRSASSPGVFVFVLLLICTSLAGLFQYIIGVARLGRVLKFAPYPVTAGLKLGVGGLMFLGGLRPALGVNGQVPWADIFQAWHPASLIVTAVSLGLCVIAGLKKSLIPGSVLALLIGSVLHHGLVRVLGADQLGDTSAGIDGLFPNAMIWSAGGNGWELLGWLPTVSSYALTIAALASLDTLLCLSLISNVQTRRPDANKELRIQGLSNLVGGMLGGTACLSNTARVTVNLANGGRTNLSRLAYVATMAIIVVLVGNHLSKVPTAVTAAIVIYYAFAMVDDGTRRLFTQLFPHIRHLNRQSDRLLLANFIVIVLVASVAMIVGMMSAVGIGVAAAMFLFVRTRMKPAIRRVLHGNHHHSLKIRADGDQALLISEGKQIVIIEADGPLFFGTADSISLEIEQVAKHMNYLIIDFKHVQDIDTTGARTLLQASHKLVAQNKQLLFCGADRQADRFLRAMGLENVVPKQNWHNDLDHALEDAEDRLLVQLGAHSNLKAVTLADTLLAAGLKAEDIVILESVMERKDYSVATQLFGAGDPGISLFIATASSVDILMSIKHGRQKRVISLAPGVFFGEMALLEGQPRSATAVLQGASTVWELSREALDRLLVTSPGIAHQVLLNISRHLANRLRSVTDDVRVLEDAR
jgi:SulP family sulfate permease